MTKEQAIREFEEWLQNHQEDYYDALEEMDVVDDDDRWVPMGDLCEYLSNYSYERVFELGMESDGHFNSSDDYFRENYWGGLESTDDRDYDDEDYLTRLLDCELERIWTFMDYREELGPIFNAYKGLEDDGYEC